MRIYLKIAICFSSLIILNSSCKKDDAKPTSVGSSAPYGLAHYSNLYGALIAGKIVDFTSPSFSDTSYNGAAVFYNSPQTNLIITAANTTTVTSVSLNNVQLYLASPAANIYIYGDTVTNLNLSRVNWHVLGTGSIPSFTHSQIDNYPSFSGFAQLPDTINIGQNIPLKIIGGLGADSLALIITSGNNKYQTPNLAGATTSYTIAQANVTNLTTTTTGKITVTYEKISIQYLSTKNFVFMKTLQFNKQVVIINQ